MDYGYVDFAPGLRLIYTHSRARGSRTSHGGVSQRTHDSDGHRGKMAWRGTCMLAINLYGV